MKSDDSKLLGLTVSGHSIHQRQNKRVFEKKKKKRKHFVKLKDEKKATSHPAKIVTPFLGKVQDTLPVILFGKLLFFSFES